MGGYYCTIAGMVRKNRARDPKHWRLPQIEKDQKLIATRISAKLYERVKKGAAKRQQPITQFLQELIVKGLDAID